MDIIYNVLNVPNAIHQVKHVVDQMLVIHVRMDIYSTLLISAQKAKPIFKKCYSYHCFECIESYLFDLGGYYTAKCSLSCLECEGTQHIVLLVMMAKSYICKNCISSYSSCIRLEISYESSISTSCNDIYYLWGSYYCSSRTNCKYCKEKCKHVECYPDYYVSPLISGASEIIKGQYFEINYNKSIFDFGDHFNIYLAVVLFF